MRRAVNPDAEVHQIMSAGGAGGGEGVAAGRRPVVRYGQDLLSPGRQCAMFMPVLYVLNLSLSFTV